MIGITGDADRDRDRAERLALVREPEPMERLSDLIGAAQRAAGKR